MSARDDEYDNDRSPEENVARGLFAIANAIGGLLYAFKYSADNGMSVAEAIEVAGMKVADAVRENQS